MEGERLGPYVIDRELGVGGMGAVYAATLEREAAGLSPGATVALKVVHPQLLATEGFFKRFLREAQIGQSVEHDNVVRTLDCDATDNHHFLVMEYVEGQTLGELLHELDRVPEELCRHVGREICKGLAAIHGAGVVHRDLKPENVLITQDHVVKVMDLGVAHLAGEQMRLSQTGAFIGSVEYAAPEQFGGGDVDHRCDLHALGLLLYELSCGQHPYRADDFRVVMHHVMDDEPRRLGEVNPQLSAFFEEVVHTLLQKSREDRFADAGELLAVLEEGEESEWWHERALALRAETNRPLRRIRIPRETAVYGREKELTKLRSLYDAAKAGDGQVILIEGEAGIGKSRLVDELIGRLNADEEDLNFLFGSYPPGGAALAAGGFSSAYRDQFGGAGSADFLSQTPLLVPAFDAVLRGEPAPTGVVELTKDSLGTCFVHATRNLATERMTVVLIDDLHFAPEEAQALFTAIALAVPEHRVLLVGTARPGVPEDWLANLSRLDHSTRMDLARLGPKDLFGLLRDSFASEQLARDLGIQIGLKSDGNPFFAFEIIRGLREGQFITQKDDGTWASTRVIDEIQIPSSVLDLVNARVADLEDEERNLLDVAACWGYQFDASLVGEAFGLGRIPVLQAMAKLEKRDRLVRSSGRQFVFDHHQVQEALYGALPEMLREEYHAALAEALETRTKAAESDLESLDGALCVDLCEHYLKGARGENALRYLARAQKHLSSGCLHAQVVALADRALTAPGVLTGAERARVLLGIAEARCALDALGRRERQEQCAREAERLAGDAGDNTLRGWAANAVANVCWRTSRLDEAVTAEERSLEIARAVGDAKMEAAAMSNLGQYRCDQGRHDEAQDLLEASLTVSRAAGLTLPEARALGGLGNVLVARGRLGEARESFEQSLELSRAEGYRFGEAIAIGNIGAVHYRMSRLSAAQESHESQLVLARELGDRSTELLATSNLGGVLDAQGRFEDALFQHERAVVLSSELGDRRAEAIAVGNSGITLLGLGRLEDACSHLERSIDLCLRLDFLSNAAHMTAHLVDPLRRLGRVDAAIEHGERAIELGRQSGDAGVQLVARGCLAQMLQREERLSDAWRSAERLRELVDDSCAPRFRTFSTGFLGSLLQSMGRLREAKEQCDRYLELCRRLNYEEGVVAAHGHIGELLYETGDTRAGERHLLDCISRGEEHGLAAAIAHAQLILGRLRADASDSRSRQTLEAARDLARECRSPSIEILASCALAVHGSRERDEALALLDRHTTALNPGESRTARLLLWKATGDRTHLVEAKGLLDDLLTKNPPEYHESMCQNVRVNREILAAWREECEGEDDDGDEPRGTESITKVGS